MSKLFSKILVAAFILTSFLVPVFSTQASNEHPNEACVYGRNGNLTNAPCSDTQIDPILKVTSSETGPCHLTVTTNNVVTNPPDQQLTRAACDALSVKATPANPGTHTETSWGALPTSSEDASYLTCGVTNLGGCIAKIFYLIFQVSAKVAELGGRFLDFFVFYSTNDASYRNDFIQQGWGAVRDVANIFFIVALLYIAIQTTLNLGGHGKKTISQIIIIALIINFSLFTTKVVIDASNILAKVFYNNINSVDPNGKPLPVGGGGQKSISIGIIQSYNPQKIITEENYKIVGTGMFIFITVLLTAITIYTAYIFFAVALLFVARVISLWIVMVFAPLAFISYTVPFDIPGFGHHKWWEHLLQNAFLAPLFIFFLYMIVGFTNFIQSAVLYTKLADDSIMQTIMAVMVPFVIIAMLLKMAKKLAVDYSGEMGKGLMKAGEIAAGVVIGGGAGLAAAGLQGTLGHAGKLIYENKDLTNADANGSRFARGLRNLAGGADGKGGMAGSSWDIRKGVVGGGLTAASAVTGINFGTKSKFLLREDGGYEADLKRRDQKRKKRAEGFKIKEGEPEKQKLNQYEFENSVLAEKNHSAIHDKDLEIEGAKKAKDSLRDLAKSTEGTPEHAAFQEKFKKASDEVFRLEQERRDIKNGRKTKKDPATGETTYNTHNGNITQREWEDADKGLKSAEEAKTKADELEKAALAEKEAAEEAVRTTAKAKTDAEAAARFGSPGDAALAKAVADATKAEEEAKKKLADAATNINSTAEATKTATARLNNAKTVSDAANEAKARMKPDADGQVRYGNSQNEYEDKLIPHQKHHVEEVAKHRQRKYAEQLLGGWPPWNEAARKESAHAIRMGAKPEKDHGGGHGGGHSGGILGDMIAHAGAELVTGGGHKEGGESRAAAGDSHGHA